MVSIAIHNQNQNVEGMGWWQSIDISGKDLNHTKLIRLRWKYFLDCEARKMLEQRNY